MKNKMTLAAILAAGMALGGCEGYESSKVYDRTLELAKPQDCETVKDIRFSDTYARGTNYQVLCDNKGKPTLYISQGLGSGWTKIEVQEESK